MIGILDSGLGGLTVAAEIMRRLPGLDVLYFGDTAHSPFGQRSAAAIRDYALRGADYLIDAGVKTIALSSHTISCVAGDFLEEKMRVPIFSVARETIAAAIAVSRNKAFGVIASPAVVESRFYTEMICNHIDDARVYAVAAPLIAALVEEGWIKRPETAMMVKKHIHPLKTRQIDTLILGNSHYSMLRKIIARKAGKRIQLVEGVSPLVERIARHTVMSRLSETPVDQKGYLRVAITEKTACHEKNARLFFNGNVKLEVIG